MNSFLCAARRSASTHVGMVTAASFAGGQPRSYRVGISAIRRRPGRGICGHRPLQGRCRCRRPQFAQGLGDRARTVDRARTKRPKPICEPSPSRAPCTYRSSLRGCSKQILMMRLRQRNGAARLDITEGPLNLMGKLDGARSRSNSRSSWAMGMMGWASGSCLGGSRKEVGGRSVAGLAPL